MIKTYLSVRYSSVLTNHDLLNKMYNKINICQRHPPEISLLALRSVHRWRETRNLNKLRINLPQQSFLTIRYRLSIATSIIKAIFLLQLLLYIIYILYFYWLLIRGVQVSCKHPPITMDECYFPKDIQERYHFPQRKTFNNCKDINLVDKPVFNELLRSHNSNDSFVTKAILGEIILIGCSRTIYNIVFLGGPVLVLLSLHGLVYELLWMLLKLLLLLKLHLKSRFWTLLRKPLYIR